LQITAAAPALALLRREIPFPVYLAMNVNGALFVLLFCAVYKPAAWLSGKILNCPRQIVEHNADRDRELRFAASSRGQYGPRRRWASTQ
jgi:hypothetical protein